jgi:CRP/FNR family transcriptional regulator, cyclic AMP receptor protein
MFTGVTDGRMQESDRDTAPVAAADHPGFLDLLPPDDRATLYAVGRKLTAPQGAVLIYEGEPGDRVIILLAGRVKVTRLSEHGKESLLEICDPGELLGGISYVDGDTQLGTVTALEPVELLAIPSAAFRARLEQAPHIASALLFLLAQRLRETTVRHAQYASSDALGRLAARLTELADRYGQQCDQGLAVTLPLSQDDLTAWAEASRASVAKALQTFRQLGWIETRRRQIIIRDPEALRTRAT